MAARLTTYLVVAIVSATLIAGLIVGAQRDDSDGPVDLIVHNARVFTADGDGTIAEAVAIRGNQVLRVGDEREVMRLRKPQTRVIDAGGATVLPGFNDAHVHLVAGGLAVNGLDLAGAGSVVDIQLHVKAWMDANPDALWIRGHGWTPPVGSPQLNRKALDAATGNRPALLMSIDGQSALANSAALKAAGITRETLEPAGGTIGRDSRTRELSGLLKGSAVELVRRVMPAPTAVNRERALLAAFSEAHHHGITSVQDIGTEALDLDALVEARRADRLTLRVYAAPEMAAGSFTDTERDRLAGLSKRFPDDPLLKTGAVAVHLGGPHAGHLRSTPDAVAPDDLNRFVRLVDAAGWQVVSQPATDQVQMTLDAYQHAARSNGRSSRGRHRLEFADPLEAKQVARVRALKAIASLQLSGLSLVPAKPQVSATTPAERTPAPFDEGRKGTIEAGMLADLVVLSTDILETRAALATARVAYTIFDGKIVYRADRGTN